MSDVTSGCVLSSRAEEEEESQRHLLQKCVHRLMSVGRCAVCGDGVDKDKRCCMCTALLCRNHRRAHGSLFSKTYYCHPICATLSPPVPAPPPPPYYGGEAPFLATMVHHDAVVPLFAPERGLGCALPLADECLVPLAQEGQFNLPIASGGSVTISTSLLPGMGLQFGACVEFYADRNAARGLGSSTSGASSPELLRLRGVVLGVLSDGTLVTARRWNPPDDLPVRRFRVRNQSPALGPERFIPVAVPKGTQITVVTVVRCSPCRAMLPIDEVAHHGSYCGVAAPVGSASPGSASSSGVATPQASPVVTAAVPSAPSFDGATAWGDVKLLERLQTVRVLGEGAQGIVVGCCEGVGSVITHVLKDIRCADGPTLTRAISMSQLFLTFRSPHVVPYLAVDLRSAHAPLGLRVVMPFFPERDLAQLIAGRREPFPEEWILSIGLQVARSLHDLHSYHAGTIAHGDIKPSNVMVVNRGEQVVLADLESATLLRPTDQRPKWPIAPGVATGTMEWTAPELLTASAENGFPTAKSDLWSLGLLLLVVTILPEFPMLPLKGPDGSMTETLVNSQVWSDHEKLRESVSLGIRRARSPDPSGHYSNDLVSIITTLLRHDPSRRPGAQQLTGKLEELMTARLLRGSA